MKPSFITVGLLALLTPLAAAWTKEDREIFRVRDELSLHEGDITFYEFLGTTPSASQEDVNKAYRQKAKLYHPDKVRQKLQKDAKKNPNGGKKPSRSQINAAVKKAEQQAQRLTIVADILRGSGRARYDHFIKNGFPVWKGTEYYYNRYRPGLGTVMLGAFAILGGGFHYLAIYLSWKRQRDFVESYIKFARHSAFGDNLGIPGIDTAGPAAAAAAQGNEEDEGNNLPMNRKMRRMQERETRKDREGSAPKRSAKARRAATPTAVAAATDKPSGPQGAKKRVVAANGKILVVDSVGDVYLEQENEDGKLEEFLLDLDDLPPPTVYDTAVFRLPAFAFRTTFGRLLGSKSDKKAPDGPDSREDTPVAAAATGGAEAPRSSSDPQRTPSTGSVGGDFEILEKSVDELGQAKSTGTQDVGKANKRKTKKKQ